MYGTTQKMLVSLGTLYDDVLGFLLTINKQNPTLYFISYDFAAISDEKKGTFFQDENYATFSFWKCTFFRDLEVYEGFYIATKFFYKTKEFTLHLTNGGDARLNIFIEKLVEFLGKDDFIQSSKKESNGKDVMIYEKNYGKWQDNLQSFIDNDKSKIDDFLIKNSQENYQIDFLTVSDFILFKNTLLDYYYLPNETLHINKINLTNIGHFENINLDLSKQVTVLIGENGSGKSTILRAIALGITGTDFFDLDKDFQRERSEIFNGFLKINEYQKAIPKYTKEGSIVLSINDKELTLQLSPSKLIATKVEIEEIKTNREIILHESKYIKTLVLGFSQSEAKTVGKDFYVKGETKPSVTDLFPLISNSGKDAMNDLVEWIYYYVHDRENTEPVDKLFAIFSKIVSDNGNSETANDIVALKRPYKTEGVVGSATGRKDIIVCMPDMPEGINLSLVSQGYKNIFRWVGGILMGVYEYQQNFFPEKSLAEISGIVLIDEIDTYLHPKWQRNILKVLVEEFPKLQFVVTTHSPLVIGHLSLWKKTKVFKIQVNQAIPKSHFYGRNPIDLFLEFYGVETRPKEIQEKIDNLYYAFEAENISEAKQILVELTEILGSDDAIVNEFTTSLTLLEELQ